MGAFFLGAWLEDGERSPEYSEVITMEQASRQQAMYQQWEARVQETCGANAAWILLSKTQVQCMDKKGGRSKVVDVPIVVFDPSLRPQR